MIMERFTHLTFDCYGTLIDWETGILECLTPLLSRYGVSVSEETLLRDYARLEAEQEAGQYRTYRTVLSNVVAGIGAKYGANLTEEDRSLLPNSVGNWPPFADTMVALRKLKSRFKLVILSNIDDAMFEQSNFRLGVDFDEVITAEQVRHYKPAMAHFNEALSRLQVPREQILHVAQSLYHDHVPAKEMGFNTAWIDRPSRLAHTGLSLPADVQPDVTFHDLQSLAAYLALL